jgi:CheY-like chemotaxis protein
MPVPETWCSASPGWRTHTDATTENAPSVILVVDHEVVSRNRVADFLHRAGYTVLAAASGKEALELCRNYPTRIDLVITNTRMPRTGGLEVSQQIAGERPEVKILLSD